MNPARLRAYFYLLIVSIIWGVATPIIKFTLSGLPPLLFLTYRFALSGLVAILFFIIAGVHLPKGKSLLLLLLYGLLTSSVSLGLLFFGLKNTTVLDATLITLITPLLAAFAGVKLLHEHVTQREKIGMAIALFGTIFTVIEPILENGFNLSQISGNFLILVYLLTTTLAAVLAKELLRQDVSAGLLTNFSFLIGFLTLIPFVLLSETPSQIFLTLKTLPFPYHLGVWFMAFLSGSFAYYLSNRAQKTIEVGEAAVFSYLYPIFAAPLAVFWLKEKVSFYFILGAVVIATGVAIAESKKSRIAS